VRSVRSAAGFALIDLLFVCGIISLLCGIAMPRLLAARGSAQSAAAISTLRVISSGQVAFAITCGSGFYAPTLTALGTPPTGTTEGFVKGDLALSNIVDKSGYQFQIFATPFASAPDTCSSIGAGLTGLAFKAGADPLDIVNNTRYFASNANNTIWEDSASLFATIPEAADPPTGKPLQR
jgi:type II secretory pathway pseudopilin PulG